MTSKLFTGVAFAALILPGTAYAQSTGTIDAEEDIVVTGSRGPDDINGIEIPDTPKAKAVITRELIERRTPGQTILDTINLVPGVNFTNADAYGSSGGQIRIRGFDGNRISLTEDGIPLNDSGNYAIYSNQQLDPELIQQVNVNFGAADVDSPTASASGGTVNYRSIIPQDRPGAVGVYSHGTDDYNRVFVKLETGIFTSFGTKAWLSASDQRYDLFRGPGEIHKSQYNARIYQPLGGNGDFVSVLGHYNQNWNNFYSNPSFDNIRTVLGTDIVPARGQITADNRYKLDPNHAQYDRLFNDMSGLYNYQQGCELPSAVDAGGGVQDDRMGCSSNSFATAQNPSNTGNIRFNSRFTLNPKLTLTVDAGYQYVKANGGGSGVFAETDPSPAEPLPAAVYNNQFGRVGAGIAAGADLNRDGDLNDFVRVYFPSNTRTQRLTAIANLRYDFNDDNSVRLAYTWDRARHRQTGEASLLDGLSQPQTSFGTDGDTEYAVRDAAGNVINKRDRLSYAILHQVSGEYRGQFFDDALKVALGVRAPFFRRNLNNYCYTIRASSNDAYCTSQTAAQVAADPRTAGLGAPYRHRIKTYDAVLPNVGLTYNFTPEASLFASYAKGFSAPRTDNLYAFDDRTFRPTDEVRPEKTDSFDLGLRYTSRIVQAQLAAWYIKYDNRIISSLVQQEGGGTINIDRNVGATKTKGIDFSVGVNPIRAISLYGFVSYLDSELKDDAISPTDGTVLAATAGKFVVETPKWQYGGRVQGAFGPVSAGVQAKHVGDRFVTDVNDLISAGYTTVDLDARVDLGFAGLERTFLQLNISNLLKERYFSNLSTATSADGSTRYTFGAPRTFIGSIHFEF